MKKEQYFPAFDILTAVGVLLFYSIVLLSLKHPTSLDDGLRHFAMATALRDVGIFNVPGWSNFLYGGYMYTTIVDPWFLSDVLLIPFTYFSVAKGLQLFILAELAVLLVSFLAVLRSLKLSALDRSLFLLVLCFGDIQFMGRFLLGRPYALMTAMTLLVMWSIFERRWVWLMVLLSVSVLLSQLFIFPLMVSVCAWIAYLISGNNRIAFKIMIASVIGFLLGLLLHAQPLNYFRYLLIVFLRIPFLKSIGLSREMHVGIMDSAFVSVLVILMLGVLLGVRLHKKRILSSVFADMQTFCISIAIIPFFTAFLLWVRAIDILWPLLLVWVACLYQHDPSAPRELAGILLPRKIPGNTVLTKCAAVACIAMVCVVPLMLLRDDASHDLSQFEALNAIPSGSRVFNLDWQLFSAFAVLRPDLSYATGIDRSFTYLTNPDVSTSIYAVENETPERIHLEDVSKIIDYAYSQFPSDYMVLSHQKFDSVIQMLTRNEVLPLVVNSSTIAVFKLPTDDRASKSR